VNNYRLEISIPI